MCVTERLLAILLCALLCAPAAPAQQSQDQQREAQAHNTISQDVMIIIQQDKVRFTAQKAVSEMQLKIFDQTGELVYDSGPLTEPELNWLLQNANGEAVKSGMYAYQLSIKEAGAADPRLRRGYFIVDRAKERDGQSDRLWITSQNDSGVGTELTVARNEDTTIAGTSTPSDPKRGTVVGTSTSGGQNGATEQGSTKRHGEGAAEAKSNAKDGMAALAVAGTGTAGQLAKFTSAEEIGNSSITEQNGNVRIAGTLGAVRDTSNDIVVQTTGGTNAWAKFWMLTPSQGWAMGTSQNYNGNQFYLTDETFGQIRMMIQPNGGEIAFPNPSSNHIVVRTSGGTNAWAQFRMQTPSQQWVLGTSQNYNGNQFYLFDATYNQNRMMIQPNGGEIAFPSPASNHVVVRTAGGTNAWAQFRMQTTNQSWAIGTSQNYNDDQLYFSDVSRNQIRMAIQTNGNVGIGTTNPQARLDVAGQTKTQSLQITGGADFAENFDVNVAAASSEEVTPKVEAGMVVSIDPADPGKLQLSTQAYDYQVAGIISGAGGVKPGMILGQEGTLANGKHPVALSGRVYCWADASDGPIKPGDLLTTSDTPGHAMKVTDRAKAQGAIIGKAMTGLKEGKGLVLVLVTLQ